MKNYVKVSEISYGSKIKKSFGSILIGIVLFLGSFAVLWWNEGRANMGKIAAKAIPINAYKLNNDAIGKFVAITGKLEAVEEIIDPDLLLSGKYISLTRIVEMYAWVEETQSEQKEKIGGKTEVITKYNYIKKWTSNPQPSSSFQYPENHENPELPYQNQTWYAEEAKIGVYKFSPSLCDLPPEQELKINENMIKKPNIQSEFIPIKIENNNIYIGEGNINHPQIGDIMIKYKALTDGKLCTLFGKLNGDFVEPYVHKDKIKFYKLMIGTFDESILNLKTYHKRIGWLFRIIGFFMMWIGMNMFFAPIHAILQFIPALSTISKTIIRIILFPIALLLSIITIFISMLMHNIIALIIIIILILTIIFFLLKSKSPSQKNN